MSSIPAKEVDNASMVTTSTFSSTVSLLKSNLKSKFSSSKEKDKNDKTETSNTKIEENKSTSIAPDINGDQKTGTSLSYTKIGE
jgi:hypothetical protein